MIEKINFFVNTAHNIRTPLSLVLAPLDNLANDSSLSEKSPWILGYGVHQRQQTIEDGYRIA